VLDLILTPETAAGLDKGTVLGHQLGGAGGYQGLDRPLRE
jgi:hypothetical protein